MSDRGLIAGASLRRCIRRRRNAQADPPIGKSYWLDCTGLGSTKKSTHIFAMGNRLTYREQFEIYSWFFGKLEFGAGLIQQCENTLIRLALGIEVSAAQLVAM